MPLKNLANNGVILLFVMLACFACSGETVSDACRVDRFSWYVVQEYFFQDAIRVAGSTTCKEGYVTFRFFDAGNGNYLGRLIVEIDNYTFDGTDRDIIYIPEDLSIEYGIEET